MVKGMEETHLKQAIDLHSYYPNPWSRQTTCFGASLRSSCVSSGRRVECVDFSGRQAFKRTGWVERSAGLRETGRGWRRVDEGEGCED